MFILENFFLNETQKVSIPCEIWIKSRNQGSYFMYFTTQNLKFFGMLQKDISLSYQQFIVSRHEIN
jgi:hypothetical protein